MFEEKLEKIISFNNKEIKVWLREGTNDYNTVFAVVAQDEYSFKDFGFKNGDTVIDLGSHIGGEMLALCCLEKKLKYYGYDPLPENVGLAIKNLKENDCKMKVKIFQKGVSGKNKKGKAWYGNLKNRLSRHHCFIGNLTNLERGKSIDVKEITLEKIFKDNKIKHCRYIKIDIEGGEKEVFDACPKEIFKKIDYIVGEFHNITRQELLNLTKGVFIDEDCAFKKEDNATLGHFKFANKRLC